MVCQRLDFCGLQRTVFGIGQAADGVGHDVGMGTAAIGAVLVEQFELLDQKMSLLAMEPGELGAGRPVAGVAGGDVRLPMKPGPF